MARTPATLRADAGVKCGGGYIAQGKKCRGQGGSPGQKQFKKGNVAPNQKAAQRLRTASRVAATVGALSPIAGLASRNGAGLVSGFGAARTAFTAAGALNTYAKAQETGSKAGRERLQKEAKGQLLRAGGEAISTASGVAIAAHQARRAKRRQTLERIYRGPSAKRDSIWADGFSADSSTWAV
jgi:hypothetical protein